MASLQHRLCAANAPPVLRHGEGEHPLRPPGRHRRGDCGGGQAGKRPRLHHPHGARLRQRRGRGRRPALHRGEAADFLCPGGAGQPPHLRAGRGHRLHRHQDRGPHPRGHLHPADRPHQLPHRPPALHHPQGGHDSGGARRENHRARHPPGADGPGRLLRRFVQQAV